ncbi:hypothetical protein [Pararhodobacter marinus]|uniref:hypothetical protein n=1 Tax=Pararhodobacter marinus TaxID=2184063 RepID=UPI003513D117
MIPTEYSSAYLETEHSLDMIHGLALALKETFSETDTLCRGHADEIKMAAFIACIEEKAKHLIVSHEAEWGAIAKASRAGGLARQGGEANSEEGDRHERRRTRACG